ncbi:MAG: protein kinase [Acidimicrobiia bacterium]|nr:protein kinase [Acidimicrobiia bacterium]
MAEEGDVVIRVLGPVSAIAGGEPITLGGPMQHRLLAILVAAGGDTVSTGSLIEQLWSTKTMPSDANRTLRNLVARLRAALGDDVVTTRSRAGYALGPVDVDADRFEELVKQGWNNPRSLTAVGIWSEAVDLWQGHAFGGYEDVLGVAPRAARLNELRAEATEAWLEARFAAGQRDELMADLNTAVRRHPLRERLRAQQMTLLATLGRQPEALRAFQDYRDALIDIGLEPSEELNDLDARIASGVGVSVAASRTLRGYRISGELGRGEFSVVYRAHQPVVDREVAIKQIRAELADRPSFIAQFDAEAQFVARIEHPHIVPVYDYWREPGSAYLVMRYMRNGSLADQIVNGPMLPERVAEIAIQVGAALDESHRLGITHGDVKPANILLDDQDRAYLSDFGIATDESQPADPSRWLSHGASSYASPEQLSRESIGAPTDVHGLGLTLYEALVGEIPFPDERSAAELLERQLNDPIPLARVMRPELPAGVDTVLQRATAKNPRDRFASAGELAASLAAAVGLDGVETKAIERRNPFKGLRPFTEADAADFVGRERLTDRLLATVGRHRLTMVVGPSGSGKSSVVAAGLVPAVRAGRLVGSGNWFVTSMAPGVDPFTALAEALLRVAVEVPPDMARRLEADPRGFNRLLRRLVPAGRTTLLVIDQFEELYTVVPQEQRQRFLDLMIEATRPADSVIRVVATLRADFFHEPLRSPGLAIAIEESTVAVHPMTSGELERAIIEPARAVGAEFEAGLVARLITDVADQSGALPMLQHLLAELYERKVDSAMTIAAYEKQGGVGGALSQRADEVFDSLTEAEKNSARALLVRLVNIGAGSIDTRRRVRRSEVVHGDDAEVVIDRFGTARLLSFDHDPVSREPTVELAHESLITRWERLGRWLSVDRDRLRVRQLLSEAALNWSRQGCDDADLFRGSRLLTTVEAVGDGSPELTQAERDFLDRSREHEEAEQEAERETSRRLNDLVDRQRVGNRRLRGALSAVGVVAVVALVAGLVAVQQRNRVDNERREAEVASLVAESLRLANDDPILAGLLAVEAFGHDQRAAAPSLFAALAASPGLDRSVSWDAPSGDRACGSLSPGGAVLAGATAAGPIYLVDDDGTQRTVGSEVVCWAAADPTGQYAAGITDRSEVRLWDLETGEVIARRPL